MQDVSRGVEDAAANSITLAVETADLVAFDRYLDGKTPSSYSNNPWFTEFYEVCQSSGGTHVQDMSKSHKLVALYLCSRGKPANFTAGDVPVFADAWFESVRD